MTSDLGECEKWLIFRESYLELIHPSTPYRGSRLSKVMMSPGYLDTKSAVILGVLTKNCNVEHIYGHVVNQDLILLSVSKSARNHSLCTYSNECYSYEI